MKCKLIRLPNDYLISTFEDSPILVDNDFDYVGKVGEFVESIPCMGGRLITVKFDDGAIGKFMLYSKDVSSDEVQFIQ